MDDLASEDLDHNSTTIKNEKLCYETNTTRVQKVVPLFLSLKPKKGTHNPPLPLKSNCQADGDRITLKSRQLIYLQIDQFLVHSSNCLEEK